MACRRDKIRLPWLGYSEKHGMDSVRIGPDQVLILVIMEVKTLNQKKKFFFLKRVSGTNSFGCSKCFSFLHTIPNSFMSDERL